MMIKRLRVLRDDLFAQQRAAQALDQVEIGATSSAPSTVTSSGSSTSASSSDRDAELARLLGGVLAGRHAADVLQPAGLEGFREGDQETIGGRAAYLIR